MAKGWSHSKCNWCNTEMKPIVEARYVGKPNPIIGLYCPKCGSKVTFPKPIEGVWPE